MNLTNIVSKFKVTLVSCSSFRLSKSIFTTIVKGIKEAQGYDDFGKLQRDPDQWLYTYASNKIIARPIGEYNRGLGADLIIFDKPCSCTLFGKKDDYNSIIANSKATILLVEPDLIKE